MKSAMQQALEYISWQAFGECRVGAGPIPQARDVVAALRAALDAPDKSDDRYLTLQRHTLMGILGLLKRRGKKQRGKTHTTLGARRFT